MSLSPMMKQYHDAKAACGDALLLFRMGDFYELFFDDAKTAARVLGLALTSRDKGENATPMAGFPHHQLDSYLGKLIASGFRAAICDQMEDPREAKGIVRREVTRIVSPGTLTDDSLLDPRECNYLASVVPVGIAPGDAVGLAWVELSTGRFFATCVARERLADQLARIDPAECLIIDEGAPPLEVTTGRAVITRRPAWAFALSTATESLTKHFGTLNLEGFGFEVERDAPSIRAAGAILEYLSETQKTSLGHIDRLTRYQPGQSLELDESTRRSLEITRTLRDGRREGSLLAAVDRTITPMGSRWLADWVANPLADLDGINRRQGAVAEMVADARLTEDIRDRLKGIHDLERLVGRVITGRATPRDLACVGKTLATLPAIKARLTARSSALLCELEAGLDMCNDLRAKIESGLADDCPHNSHDGGFIRAGYSKELDGLRELATGGKQWIAQYQADEISRTGISSLKIGFNKVFGYYLEVTHTHGDKIPDSYIRKQTVKNAERYITPELKEYEEKVLTADEKSKELEHRLFIELREMTAIAARRLQANGAVLAQLDVLASLATLARQRNYCRPQCVAEPVLKIVDGRHPVLDILLADGSFVPNDIGCGPEDGLLQLITGPNMAGKSTYIRQVALMVLLAQIGSFVPANKATIGVADRIFARVGASDELARGQSTFMVEMTETARILNLATPRSVVILDEIGRGTSTYDGVSLAWAVVEYLHDRIGCRTFFATHYHELTELARTLPDVRNLNVAVREWEDQLVFLHKIVPGPADKSYGIHVARLAGVPREVNERAKEILSRLEQQHTDGDGRPKLSRRGATRRAGQLQLTLFEPQEHPLVDQIRKLDLHNTTPLKALEMLETWQKTLAPSRNGD